MPTARKSLSKTLRFEIFKRDGFTCQYCGQRPPDIVLEVDHIQPRAHGGTNDEINLITSCADCNRGKSDRHLGDIHPRPRADLAYLEVQQEVAEARRYQRALEERENALLDVIIALTHLWQRVTDDDLDWHPKQRVMRQFLSRYSPEVVEAAIRDVAPKVLTGYVSSQGNAWVRYMWVVMRNIAAEPEQETPLDEGGRDPWLASGAQR